MKIKIFYCHICEMGKNDVEEEINNWLNTDLIQVVDMQTSISNEYYTCTIMYLIHTINDD